MILREYNMFQSNDSGKSLPSSLSSTTTADKCSVGFKDLGLESKLLECLEKSGFSTPTVIQEKTIPLILEGKDLIAQAKTGSGKTLAFALPTLQNLSSARTVEVLVLTPTRELAQQVADVYRDFARKKRVGITCVVGRESYSRQIEGINGGSQIVIATPGRLLDLLQSKRLKKFQPQTVILDEADEMLNMGFIEDIRSILGLLPKKRQTIFFSATFPPQIVRLATAEQQDPSFIRLDQERQQASTSIEQHFYILNEQERKDALIRLFDFEQPHKAIIFCRTKSDTESLQNIFLSKKFKSKVLHGDLSQADRSRTLRDFKSGIYKILIATDVASRGLDVDDLSHVFNFHVPENFDRYTHRIGRTGRAGKKGKALTLTTISEWSNHFFLRKMDTKNIILSQLPDKSKVEESIKSKLLKRVQDINYTENTKNVCEAIIAENDSFELLCKLFTLVADDHKVLGPQNIGLSSSRLKSFLSNIRSYKCQTNSRGRFRGRASRPYSGSSSKFSSKRRKRY